mmetsp:Transcript_1237/g.3599  ORF Transcript_1237/g.3599 Transcript_1237/m.3599 type:complete len:325 (-) Transcript_1237:1656-2630(-)
MHTGLLLGLLQTSCFDVGDEVVRHALVLREVPHVKDRDGADLGKGFAIDALLVVPGRVILQNRVGVVLLELAEHEHEGVQGVDLHVRAAGAAAFHAAPFAPRRARDNVQTKGHGRRIRLGRGSDRTGVHRENDFYLDVAACLSQRLLHRVHDTGDHARFRSEDELQPLALEVVLVRLGHLAQNEIKNVLGGTDHAPVAVVARVQGELEHLARDLKVSGAERVRVALSYGLRHLRSKHVVDEADAVLVVPEPAQEVLDGRDVVVLVNFSHLLVTRSAQLLQHLLDVRAHVSIGPIEDAQVPVELARRLQDRLNDVGGRASDRRNF